MAWLFVAISMRRAARRIAVRRGTPFIGVDAFKVLVVNDGAFGRLHVRNLYSDVHHSFPVRR